MNNVSKCNDELDLVKQKEQDTWEKKHQSDKAKSDIVGLYWILHIVALGVTLGAACWGYSLLNRSSWSNGWVFILFLIGGIAFCFSITMLIFSFVSARTGGMKRLLLAGSIILFVGFGACAYGIYALYVSEKMFWMWTVFALGVLSLITAIVSLCNVGYLKRVSKRYGYAIEKIKKDEEQIQSKILLAEQEVERVRADEWPKVQAQNEADIAEAHRKIEDIRKNQIEPLTKLCNDFYDTLLENYGNSLDKRDWAYLDLVIFYIETNRAESIREALQQIDRERQTQQIVASMREATEQICLSIKTEMRSLGQSIEYGFNRLESSVSDMKNSFNRRISSLQASVENSAAQTQLLASAQISQSTLTNALLAKSNATSEQLMNDVNYIRQRLY